MKNLSSDLFVHPSELFIAIITQLIRVLLHNYFSARARLTFHLLGNLSLHHLIIMHAATTANVQTCNLRFPEAGLLLLKLFCDHFINFSLALVGLIAIGETILVVDGSRRTYLFSSVLVHLN